MPDVSEWGSNWKVDWGQTLLEARRAYRSVALYQDRLLEMVRATGDALAPLRFANWCATNHDMPPGRAVDPKDRWTWDFIPLYSGTVVYNRTGERRWTITPGECFVMAIFRADSQFRRDLAHREHGGPDPQALGAPEDAESRFELIAYQWTADGEKSIDYWSDFYARDAMEGRAQAEVADHTDRGFRAMKMGWNMEQIDGDQALRDAVSEFRNRVAEAFGLDPDNL